MPPAAKHLNLLRSGRIAVCATSYLFNTLCASAPERHSAHHQGSRLVIYCCLHLCSKWILLIAGFYLFKPLFHFYPMKAKSRVLELFLPAHFHFFVSSFLRCYYSLALWHVALTIHWAGDKSTQSHSSLFSCEGCFWVVMNRIMELIKVSYSIWF